MALIQSSTYCSLQHLKYSSRKYFQMYKQNPNSTTISTSYQKLKFPIKRGNGGRKTRPVIGRSRILGVELSSDGKI